MFYFIATCGALVALIGLAIIYAKNDDCIVKLGNTTFICKVSLFVVRTYNRVSTSVKERLAELNIPLEYGEQLHNYAKSI